MEWQDEAIVLSARRHGESGVIAALLTREHGRHMGMVRKWCGGAKRGVLQPGNHVRVTWRARLWNILVIMTSTRGRPPPR